MTKKEILTAEDAEDTEDERKKSEILALKSQIYDLLFQPLSCLCVLRVLCG
ncbi:MAG: hypothetical protein QOC96_2918 [Acidobacteriota bacterium]|nr:hypothetical protein [Acidobacteriota bacterium]